MIKNCLLIFLIFLFSSCTTPTDMKTTDNENLQINIIKEGFVIVISEEKNKIESFDEKKIVNKIKKYLKKYSLKDTVNLIVETEKINKKKVYDLCLKIKNEKNN